MLGIVRIMCDRLIIHICKIKVKILENTQSLLDQRAKLRLVKGSSGNCLDKVSLQNCDIIKNIFLEKVDGGMKLFHFPGERSKLLIPWERIP